MTTVSAESPLDRLHIVQHDTYEEITFRAPEHPDIWGSLSREAGDRHWLIDLPESHRLGRDAARHAVAARLAVEMCTVALMLNGDESAPIIPRPSTSACPKQIAWCVAHDEGERDDWHSSGLITVEGCPGADGFTLVLDEAQGQLEAVFDVDGGYIPLAHLDESIAGMARLAGSMRATLVAEGRALALLAARLG